MPAPYSDNLYSADDSDFDEVPDDSLDAHLSPTDGYFQSSTSLSAGGIYPPQQQESHFHNSEDNVTDATTFPTSAAVPHVPNVLVQDPSLLQREQQEQGSSSSKKDREAKEETRLNTSFHQHHHNNGDDDIEAQSRHYSSTHRRTSSSVSAIDDFYDDGASSTAADSEATPSHTTYTSNVHSHSHSHSHSHAAQSSSSYTPYSPSTDAPLRTPQTHSRYSSNNPASLFRIPSEAPPAYTPSPTSPLSSSPTEFRNYQTFNTISRTANNNNNNNNINMGAPEEERRLLGRDPESMGDVPYDDNDDDHDPRPPPSWKDRALKKFPWASRRTLKMVLLAALVFFTLTGFLSMLASTVINAPSEKSPAKEPPQQYDPVTGLPIKDGSPVPSDPSKPAEPGEAVPWRPSSTCLQTEHRFEPKFFDLTFAADKDISVLQAVENDSPSRGYQPQVSGDFVIRRQQAGRPGPSIELEVVSNDPALDVSVEWNAEQQLIVRTPQRIEWTQSRRPCMTVRATVWVPEGASLRHVLLMAMNLDVRVVDDLSVNLADGLEIGTMSGDVHSPVEVPATYHLNSRDILVKTISGDIVGSWPLYDSLKINSESGDIITNVSPQQVLDARPRPAVLEVATISGDITVKEPLAAAAESSKPDTVVPPRDYITTIDTKSGSIKAWVAFSSAAVAESISGDIAAEFLPVYNVSLLQAVAEPELHTKTKSGNTAVKILEPIWVEILGTEGAYEGEKPRANPDEPVDIPTNPLPIPDKIPRMPGVPFTPIGAGPWKRIPLPGGRHLDDAWREVRRHPFGDAITASSEQERAVSIRDQPPMRHLKSSHGSVSGSMELKYPASWEGTVEAESISGKINILGKDVKIDSRTKWPKAVHAHKGQAWNCQVSLGSVSGDEVLIIGEEK
ncbi:hypothetical protein HER10_EVM0007950 [Colletotrichum scovillei]|uniref:Calcium-binding mitochondrial carrier SAL1 n=1 Tax=Colletotrichum scovillei TaxID=1209932 RepID=A0A9P7R1C1_9PEZI|nr:uncharacterized protein HER10_EVM0007950 [Colletotrichum scovillei]KAF4776669.1 hypothetical protein HER10_EVM0007950 [Colletotrichum scovillei]KAG7047762.1 Calcium-binding mitochondrial carrier SAL1 [Colletotrichum scovillei]KAG7060109.1 Calcium-binding mitochondrial carrier SAL1 [Colletotrichum scovillei]KAG7067528.1 Calcium-binding mitochondrial carrier SAL1 [Colletotrichum scovillei]